MYMWALVGAKGHLSPYMNRSYSPHPQVLGMYSQNQNESSLVLTLSAAVVPSPEPDSKQILDLETFRRAEVKQRKLSSRDAVCS